MRNYLKIVFSVLIVFIFVLSLNAKLVPLWERKCHIGKYNILYSLCVDSKGNLITVGYSYTNISGNDWLIISYDKDGRTNWIETYNSTANENDTAYDVTIDNYDNIYVTGYDSFPGNGQFHTKKYTPEGILIWQRSYDFSSYNDGGRGIAWISPDILYATGYANNGNSFLIKYNAESGIIIKTQEYDIMENENDYFSKCVIDNVGNLYITGYQGNIFTLKYNSLDEIEWIRVYNSSGTGGVDIDIDSQNNVYVIGSASPLVLLKYTPSGNLVWARIYNNYDGKGVAVDKEDYIYVGADSQTSSDSNFFIIKYDSNGDLVWTNKYNTGSSYTALCDIEVDSEGNIYATGSIGFASKYAYTVKFLQYPPSVPKDLQIKVLSTNSIELKWNDTSNSEDGFTIYRSTNGITFSILTNILPDTTIYTDIGVSANSYYWYLIGATNACGTSISSYTLISKTSIPEIPSIISVNPISTNMIEIKWNDNSVNEDGFTIHRSTDGNTFQMLTNLLANTSIYTDKDLSKGTTYWYKIIATNLIGNSGFSEQRNCTTLGTENEKSSKNEEFISYVIANNHIKKGHSDKVKFYFKKRGEITIYRIDGKKIVTIRGEKGEIKGWFDPSLPSGIYVVVIKFEGEKKIIKKILIE